MRTEFFRRIRREFTLTAERVRETTLAISERVNRKTQALKLHWQASSLCDQLEAIQQELGLQLSDLRVQEEDPLGRDLDVREAQRVLSEKAARVQRIKKELLYVDQVASQLEAEVLGEDLVMLERDLFVRSATLKRVRIVPGAAVVGRPVSQLGLPSSTRVIAVFRGPTLLASPASERLRSGDVAMLLGRRDDVNAILPEFLERKRVSA